MSTMIEVWSHATALADMTPRTHHVTTFLADGTFPDPPPKELPGKAQEGVNTVIGILKTIVYAAAMGAFLFVCIGMAMGVRGRSNYAKDAVMHLPWVFASVIGVGAGVAILDSFT